MKFNEKLALCQRKLTYTLNKIREDLIHFNCNSLPLSLFIQLPIN